MGWNVNSLIFLLGLPVVGVCATALYLFYSQDDDDLEDPVRGVKTSRATVLQMKIPKSNVGVVIGRAGSNIKEIEQRSDTKINFKNEEDDDESRTCIIRGSNEAVHLAEAMIHEIIMNQPLIDSFEMWIPQRAIGRIIGRGGESIRDISRSSNAKISVDRASSNSDGERRVVIKGTSEQIAVAKSVIEDRVEEDAEARRKLEMSVANRSPRSKSYKALDMVSANYKNEYAAKRQSFERLVPVSSDQFLEVYVSAVCNPFKFWVQMISPKTVELDHLVEQMTDYYQNEVNKELHEIKEVRVGQIVAATFDYDKKWYRAEVCKIDLDEYDEKESKLDLYYVDYGDSGFRKLSEVCQLRTEFLKLIFQAIECCLAHVKPRGDTWSEEAIDLFEEMSHVALWRPLRARIVNYKENEREGSPVPCVELFDTSGPKDIDIGTELVLRGFAIADETLEPVSKDATCSEKKGIENRTIDDRGHNSLDSHDVG